MKNRFMLVNFKKYDGKNGIKLAKLCEKVAKKHDVEIAIAPRESSIEKIYKEVSIPIFSQHLGQGNGEHYIKKLKDYISGSLVNHSDNQLSNKTIEYQTENLRDNGLISICCAGNINEVVDLLKYRPDYMALEPHGLIGGNVSVTEDAKELKTSVRKIEMYNSENGTNIKPSCGAGVRSGRDLSDALEMNNSGVLVSSVITESRTKQEKLEELARELRANRTTKASSK